MGTATHLPTVVAFCAGYAGIERGLELAGVEHRVLAYVEIEAYAIANLVAKMETGQLDPAPVYTDLKTFPAHLFRGVTDILTGGYPCQPFSAAGRRLGQDDPRHLWPFIDHHIGVMHPGRVFFENVEGHISLGLSTVLSDLEERGYGTAWGIFSAAEVGAPHQRKRVYIMGDALGGQRDGRSDQPRREAQGGTVTPGTGEGGRARHVADAQRQGLERHAGNGPGSNGQEREVQEPGRPASAVSLCERTTPPDHWPAEPNVGRVVNGCPNRVDRIRLLGNGVVPQTAARAWQVLDDELNQSVPDCGSWPELSRFFA